MGIAGSSHVNYPEIRPSGSQRRSGKAAHPSTRYEEDGSSFHPYLARMDVRILYSAVGQSARGEVQKQF
jgi:hypothetical protein